MHLEFGLDWGNAIGYECPKANHCSPLRDYQQFNDIQLVHLYKLSPVKYTLGKIKYYICGEKKNYNHKKVIRIFGLLHMNRRIGVGSG